MNLDLGPRADMDRLRPATIACIPSFNERSLIAEVVEGALDFVDLVVVIDDGSVDGTPKIAQEAGAVVVRHPFNLGYGRALQSCFEIAAQLNPKALVILDGDGQHLPSDIPLVSTPVLEGEVDLCIGSRLLPSSVNSGIPSWRQLGIRFITGTVNALMDSPIPLADSQCGFRAYAPSAYQSLHLRTDGMGASVEILWQCQRMGLRIREVPVRCLYHVEGSRISAIRQGLDVLWVNMLSAMNLLNGSALEGHRQTIHAQLRKAFEEVIHKWQGECHNAGGVPDGGREGGMAEEGALTFLMEVHERRRDANQHHGEGAQNRDDPEDRSHSS